VGHWAALARRARKASVWFDIIMPVWFTAARF
jgi:hypothetical protein